MIRKFPYLCEMCKKHFDEPNIVKENHCKYNVCHIVIVSGLHDHVLLIIDNITILRIERSNICLYLLNNQCFAVFVELKLCLILIIVVFQFVMYNVGTNIKEENLYIF